MAYGLEIYADDGVTKLVQPTSDLIAFVASDNVTVPAGGNVVIPITGMLNNALWHVIISGGIANFFTVTKASGQFTISNNDTTTARDAQYWVVRKG